MPRPRGNRMRKSSPNWMSAAADRPPQVPRRHAAPHNHRGSRQRPGYDQIQPPTAASNDQNQAGEPSAAPQSRAWTADNTGLPELQRSCRVWVVAVGLRKGSDRRLASPRKMTDQGLASRPVSVPTCVVRNRLRVVGRWVARAAHPTTGPHTHQFRPTAVHSPPRAVARQLHAHRRPAEVFIIDIVRKCSAESMPASQRRGFGCPIRPSSRPVGSAKSSAVTSWPRPAPSSIFASSAARSVVIVFRT